MGKIVAVVNQKGGVGKTTTVINAGYALAEKGQKMLILDLDPQGNTTSGFGVDPAEAGATAYDLLMDPDCCEEAVIRTSYQLDLIVSDEDLAGAELEMIDIPQRETLLKQKLERLRERYDRILIDCPPSLNLLTINALSAADTVWIPVQCEYYALEGLSQLLRTLDLVRKKLNPNLGMDGILFTMVDARTNLSADVINEVTTHLPGQTFSTRIPRNIRLGEAPSHGMPVLCYDRSSAGAKSYLSLAEEILKKDREKGQADGR